MRKLLLLVLAALLQTALVFAQAMDGNLLVEVLDPTGAVVPAAKLSLRSASSDVLVEAETGDVGQYLFRNVLAGDYSLTVRSADFEFATLEHVTVPLNRTATATVSLSLSSVRNVVSVRQAPVLIDTTSAQIASSFQSTQVMQTPASALPLGVLNLSLLNAGVASSGALGVGEGPSVGGQRPRANNFTIEGVDNNQKDLTLHNVDVPREAVAEFSLLQNQYSAEFGGGSGAQFNTVIRGGGNQIHGAAFEYFMNRNLNAVDESAARQGIRSNPRFDSNILGGSIGGPAIRDKLYFYTLFQYNPTGQAATPSSAVMSPTAAGYDALASMPQVSQTNLNVLRQYLAPAPSASATTSVGSNQIPVGILPLVQPSYSNSYQSVSSIDHNLSATDQLRLRYIYTRRQGFNSDTLPVLPSFFQGEQIRSHLVSLGQLHSFSANVLNEFRAGFTRYDNVIPAGDYQFPGLDAFPNLLIRDDLNVQLGPFSQSPQSRVLNTYQLVDNVSWTAGRHTIKFGWEGRKYINSTTFNSSVRGNYQYSSLAPFLLDRSPDLVAERTVGSAPFPGNQFATSAFFNDEIRLRRNLTLTLGVRYGYQGILAGDKLQALNSISDVPGLITFGVPKAQRNNWAPRVGLAYAPGSAGRTTIRAGFGLAYDKYFDNLSLNARPPQLSTTVTLDPSAATPGFLAAGGIRSDSAGNSFSTAADARANTAGYIFDRQIPYAINWNLGVQQVFLEDFVVEVRYLGTRGVHLPAQTRLNIAAPVQGDRSLPTFLTAPAPSELTGLPYTLGDLRGIPPIGQAYLPYFNAAPLTAFPFRGNSIYHGLATEVTRRFARGVFFRGAYTWSHNIDDSTADLASTLLAPRRPEDYDDMRRERGNSFLDRRHRFTMAWTWEMPFFRQNSNWVMRNVMGGYSLSGTYMYESPQLVTVQSGVDTNLNFDADSDRAIVNVNGIENTGSAVYGIDRNGTRVAAGNAGIVAYIAQDPTAQYIQGGLGARNNSGRGTLPTRPINNVDLAVRKSIPMGEAKRLEFAVHAFNALNHAQYVPGFTNNVQFRPGVNTRNNLIPGNPMFNRPDLAYASNARTLQLVARVEF